LHPALALGTPCIRVNTHKRWVQARKRWAQADYGIRIVDLIFKTDQINYRTIKGPGESQALFS
jgi:hypothetical protein